MSQLSPSVRITEAPSRTRRRTGADDRAGQSGDEAREVRRGLTEIRAQRDRPNPRNSTLGTVAMSRSRFADLAPARSDLREDRGDQAEWHGTEHVVYNI
ncbi:LOW QUALITY PROTEIN: hypothetical protein OPAG_05341, partial [Rhodococcus opacus PD630]